MCCIGERCEPTAPSTRAELTSLPAVYLQLGGPAQHRNHDLSRLFSALYILCCVRAVITTTTLSVVWQMGSVSAQYLRLSRGFLDCLCQSAMVCVRACDVKGIAAL